VAALFGALTLAMTWTVAFDPSHRFASGLTDPPFTMWTMAWEARQIETDPLNLYNANIFYPERGTLAYSSLNLAPMFVEFPILRASGNPILAYNFVYLFAWWLIGFATFLLAYSFRLSIAASIVSGALAEFSSFSFSQIGHLEILWFAWIPLFFVAAFAYLKRGNLSNLLVSLIFFLLGSLATWYFAIYLSLAAILLTFYALRFSYRQRALMLGAVIPIAWLILLPFALPYLDLASGYEKTRTLDQAELFSARLDSYLRVPHSNQIWQNALGTAEQGEANLFPGIAFLVLSAMGIRRFWRRGPRARFWVILGAVSAALTFGPILRLADGTTIALPESLLRSIPGYALTRVPSRWALFSTIAFALCAGAGVDRIAQKRGWAAAALVLIAVAENFSAPLPTSTLPTRETLEPEYQWLAAQPPTTIIELPITNYPDSAESAVGYMYRSIFHHHALVNGYADYIPGWYGAFAQARKNFPSDESIALFKKLGARFVVVHTNQFAIRENNLLTPVAQFDHAVIYELPFTNYPP